MRFVPTLAVLAALAPCIRAQATEQLHHGKVVDTTLDRIREHPDAFKGVCVRFTAQFCSIGKVSNPFFTQFVPSEYANFYAWSADQPIWRKPQWDDVCGTLFLAKSHEQLTELYTFELYDRMSVTAVVRNVFQSRPWIEVTEFTRVTGKVNTPTLAHLFRGESFMERRQWSRAVSELSLASVGDVPNDVLAATHENLGVCYLRIGEADQAQTHLETAMRLRGDDATSTLQNLYAVAQNSPELQLDREVEAVQVGDHERPMWEAFEDAKAVPMR